MQRRRGRAVGWGSTKKDTIKGMRRKIEEGNDDPADGTGGALLRKLISIEQTGGGGGDDDTTDKGLGNHRMALSDAEIVTQIKGYVRKRKLS